MLATVETSLSRAAFASQMMRTMLLDLLDLGDCEKGTFKITNDFFDLNFLLSKAFEVLEVGANQKNVRFEAKHVSDSNYFA